MLNLQHKATTFIYFITQNLLLNYSSRTIISVKKELKIWGWLAIATYIYIYLRANIGTRNRKIHLLQTSFFLLLFLYLFIIVFTGIFLFVSIHFVSFFYCCCLQILWILSGNAKFFFCVSLFKTSNSTFLLFI